MLCAGKIVTCWVKQCQKCFLRELQPSYSSCLIRRKGTMKIRFSKTCAVLFRVRAVMDDIL